jgi:hypothetical protein
MARSEAGDPLVLLATIPGRVRAPIMQPGPQRKPLNVKIRAKVGYGLYPVFRVTNSEALLPPG